VRYEPVFAIKELTFWSLDAVYELIDAVYVLIDSVYALNEDVITNEPVLIKLANEDVATATVLPTLLPTYVYPFCKEAVNEPESDKSPAVFTEIPIGLPYPSSKPISVAEAVLLVPKCISD
jgi:hypothetical protein